MLAAGTRILDFDGSVTSQLGHGLPPPQTIVDFRDLGPAARLWASAAQCDEIRRRLSPAHRHHPTFIGSGDFHYVSALLLGQFAEPLTLIVFDHHPDWERLPPRFGCGAWLNRALELPHVRRVVHVGAGSTDLDFPAALTGNRRAVRNGQVQLIPWRTLTCDPGSEFLAAVGSITTRHVYVSVDKDCLRSGFALTNWEEGNLELEFLLRCLRTLRESHEIVGLDITGDYSPVQMRSRLKSWCARFDHPRRCTAEGHAADEIARLNAGTNREILAAIGAA